MSLENRYQAGGVRLEPAQHDEEANPACEWTDDDGCLPLVACLPHQCDSWRIGGPDEIRLLIHDLIDALNKLEPGATMPQTEAGFKGRT